MFTSSSNAYPKIGIQKLVCSLPKDDVQIRSRCKHTLMSPALKLLRQEDSEFKAGMSYIVNASIDWTT